MKKKKSKKAIKELKEENAVLRRLALGCVISALVDEVSLNVGKALEKLQEIKNS